jgi:hypothetical protein
VVVVRIELGRLGLNWSGTISLVTDQRAPGGKKLRYVARGVSQVTCATFRTRSTCSESGATGEGLAKARRSCRARGDRGYVRAGGLLGTEPFRDGTALLPGGRAGFLQLDEDHVCRSLADVLSVMVLCWQPAHGP